MPRKQTSNAANQQQHSTHRSQDQRITLIRNVGKHPRLYKNEFLRTPFLNRHEKQQIWDKIAQESGFETTEDAKGKWRSLTNYLRLHLDSVSQKKIRRYIPVTDNPEDKYVQLTDWSFYRELAFVVPYIKYAASKRNNGENRIGITPSEIDFIINDIEADDERKYEHNEKSEKELKLPLEKERQNETEEEQQQIIKDSKLVLFKNDDDLMEDDVILKEYFENMLKTTLKLPRFHQNRIKQKLLDCVNEQKELNKIN